MRRIINNKKLKGQSTGSVILTTTVGILLVIALAVVVWFTLTYSNLKHTFDLKVAAREEEAARTVTDKLEGEFLEREKSPYSDFVGPDDLGRVAFSYPKTWSTYIKQDGLPYVAFFHPKRIRPIKNDSRYALRLIIENADYAKTLAKYDGAIKKGHLKQTVIKIDGQQATRFDGKFSPIIDGSSVVFKIRDKTVTLRTDADEVFSEDFNRIIEHITFNK